MTTVVTDNLLEIFIKITELDAVMDDESYSMIFGANEGSEANKIYFDLMKLKENN